MLKGKIFIAIIISLLIGVFVGLMIQAASGANKYYGKQYKQISYDLNFSGAKLSGFSPLLLCESKFREETTNMKSVDNFCDSADVYKAGDFDCVISPDGSIIYDCSVPINIKCTCWY